MNKLTGIFLLIVLFIASIYCSFFFEGSYRELIRKLYVTLTNGKISFIIPKKFLHFASGSFVVSFGLFMITSCLLFYRQTAKQRIVNIILGLLLFVVSVLMQCFVDGQGKLITCTACDDGRLKLSYYAIDYDAIFIISLVIAIIPFATTEIKQRLKIKRQKALDNRI